MSAGLQNTRLDEVRTPLWAAVGAAGAVCNGAPAQAAILETLRMRTRLAVIYVHVESNESLRRNLEHAHWVASTDGTCATR